MHDNPEKLEEIVQIINQNNEENDGYGLFAHLVPPPNSAAYRDEIEGKQQEIRDDPEFWWNWNINNWGTKWDATIDHCGYMNDNKKVLVLDFDTAWAPPIGIFEALYQQGYTVDAAYMECGANFWGNWVDGYDEGGEMSAYVVDKFGRTYAEWDELEEGSEGKGKKITKTNTYPGGRYSYDEYEHEWEVCEVESHKKAMKIGITEEQWDRCDLGIIRGG